MNENRSLIVTLHPQELEAVYAISQAVAKAVDTENALDEIINLVRPVFIFDTIVLYEQCQENSFEPTYARAIGRGRFKEADLAWGEPVAQDAHRENRTIMRVEVDTSVDDRTNIRHLLGLPLALGEQTKGALVFIRFGGPEYKPEQISLAEFLFSSFFSVGLSPANHYIVKGRQNGKNVTFRIKIVE